jgi:glycerophosphoryl diester phosphodiesterase
MVKFGRHCRAFAEENPKFYVVPYDDIRNKFIENISSDEKENNPIHQQAFTDEWRSCLKLATRDFDERMVSLWALVFQGCCHSKQQQQEQLEQQEQDTTTIITNAAAEDPCETSCLEPIRGALPDTALRFYLQKSNMDSCNELLNLVKQIYNTALTNAEALRKLVKKFDKQHKKRLSFSLLPEVYGASFTVGQATLQAGISLIRANLGLEEGYDDYDEDETGFVDTYQNADAHDKSVRRRKEELDWLKRLVAEIVKVGEIDHLVAHRGFHSVLDRSDCRPLENSLAAYEACWTSGIPICECDIALTKDEKLVLAHDKDFSRLALDPAASFSKKQVSELTYRELISMPLKSGIRPPLLIDVLRSASAIGGKSQLMIEIKPGNVATASALARLFLRHPDLMSRCAGVISFDAFAMHTLRKDLKSVIPIVEQAIETGEDNLPRNSSISFPTTMSIGNLAVGYRAESTDVEDSAVDAPGSTGRKPLGSNLGHRGRTDSLDHFGVGFSFDGIPKTRSGSFVFTPVNAPKAPVNGTLQSQGVYDYQIGSSPTTSPYLTSLMSASSEQPIDPKPLLLPPRAIQNTSPSQISPVLAGLTISSSQSSSPVQQENNVTTTRLTESIPMLIPPRAISKPVLSPSQDYQQPQSPKQTSHIPKLMLLTVSEEPKNQYELLLHVENILQVENWLGGGENKLDGAYLQFEPSMLTKEGAAKLRSLSERGWSVGVWGYLGKDPDCYESFHHLVKEGGVEYVNTDLPRKFKKGCDVISTSRRKKRVPL